MKVSLLPAVTQPPDELIERLHTPVKQRYSGYRDCLRWEFGFSCAFCWLHESDLSQHGIVGTGLTWIEHLEPVSTSPEKADDYENCFYSCKFCNRARSNRPVESRDGKGRLLDPCTTAWAEQFEARQGHLSPRSGDASAAYTHETYDLDDPRKVTMRRLRENLLNECFALFEEGPGLLKALEERLATHPGLEVLEAARFLRSAIFKARADVMRFQAIPQVSAAQCKCRGTVALQLPKGIKRQAISFDLPSSS